MPGAVLDSPHERLLRSGDAARESQRCGETQDDLGGTLMQIRKLTRKKIYSRKKISHYLLDGILVVILENFSSFLYFK